MTNVGVTLAVPGEDSQVISRTGAADAGRCFSRGLVAWLSDTCVCCALGLH